MYLCKVKKSTLLFLLGFFLVSMAYSQATFDDHMIDVAIPVDGGIITVIGGAVVYGVYINRNKNKS